METEWPPGMLATLIDSMTEAVALLDGEGRVLACHAALSRMSGYSAAEWSGESLGLLFSRPGDRAPKREELKRALREGSVTGETAGVRRDGSALWLRYHVVRLTEGEASGVRRWALSAGTEH